VTRLIHHVAMLCFIAVPAFAGAAIEPDETNLRAADAEELRIINDEIQLGANLNARAATWAAIAALFQALALGVGLWHLRPERRRPPQVRRRVALTQPVFSFVVACSFT